MHVAPDRDPDRSILWVAGRVSRGRSIVHPGNGALLGHLQLEFPPRLEMTLTSVPLANKDMLAAPDLEVDLIRCLVEMVAEDDPHSDRMAIVNFYVAMKSKPMLILPGDARSDKTVLVRALTRVLIGESRLQYQILEGHPWWVGTRGASRILTTIHTRFVTEKILATIDEASQPENSERVYIVCLSQISPAELSSCFIEVAYQLSHGEIMRIGDVHLSRSLRYPDNMWLLGTIDESHLIPQDEHLMAEAMIIRQPYVEKSSYAPYSGCDWAERQVTFLQSRIRDTQTAYQKLQSILSEHGTTLAPILKVLQCLDNHGLPLPSSALDDCVIYLANAWSAHGQGLFNSISYRNLEMATDLAIVQILLPRIDGRIKSLPGVRQELYDLLLAYPSSLALLGIL